MRSRQETHHTQTKQYCSTSECFDKKRAALLWFASGFVRQAWNMVLRSFLPNTTQFGETRHIFTGIAPQSKLYKTAHFQEVWRTRRDKHSTQYAALFSAVAEAFVALILTCTIYTHYIN